MSWGKKSHRVFQIELKAGGKSPLLVWGKGKFSGDWGSIIEWWVSEEWLWPFKPSSRLKAIFHKYWPSIKIKVSITCVYKDYDQHLVFVICLNRLQLTYSIFQNKDNLENTQLCNHHFKQLNFLNLFRCF